MSVHGETMFAAASAESFAVSGVAYVDAESGPVVACIAVEFGAPPQCRPREDARGHTGVDHHLEDLRERRDQLPRDHRSRPLGPSRLRNELGKQSW